jgi:hypothetical protein
MAKKTKTPKQDEVNKPKKAKREVKVVKCPGAFPISTKAKKRPRESNNGYNEGAASSRKNSPKLLDLHEAAKDIRAYGAQAFLGKQKKDYQDEKYYKLTGMHKKKQSCPLPLLRGLRKAAAKREKKAREEAQKSGLVIPKKNQETFRKSMTDADFHKYGPAPNIGFMKGGVYRASTHKERIKRDSDRKRR